MKESEIEQVLEWLAYNEIEDMKKYVRVLKTEILPDSARPCIWFLALTKSWFKRAIRRLRSGYTVFCLCTSEFPCPECYNAIVLPELVPDAEPEKGSEKAQTEEKAKKQKMEDEKKEKEKKDKKKQSKPEEPGQKENREVFSMVSDTELKEILNNLDAKFEAEERHRKKEPERLYLVHCVLNAMKEAEDYKMIAKNEAVDVNSLNRVLAIFACTFTYFTRMDPEGVFRILFLLCSNLCGFFFTTQGQKTKKTEYIKFLIFVQNLTAISKKKYLLFLDVLSTLNQEMLASFISKIIQGKINLSGVKADLLVSFSDPSAEEIEAYKKNHPYQIPRIFNLTLMFYHKRKQEIDVREIKEENQRLRQNIDTLLSDMQYFNTCEIIAQLKKELLQLGPTQSK